MGLKRILVLNKMEKNMATRNKGEWTELYSFLKTIRDKKIILADKNLNIVNYNSNYKKDK